MVRAFAILTIVMASTGALASDQPHKRKPAKRPDPKPQWELPLPVERKPVERESGFAPKDPHDKSLHFGTVTVTPSGFLAIETGRGHD